LSSRARRLALPAAALAVVAVIVVEVLSAGGKGDAGRPAPALPTAALQPPAVTLADLRGHPTLIDFWASWCAPCRKEAPELARLSRSLPPGSRLIGVDYTDREDGASAFVHRYGWRFPILVDPDGIYGARYGFSGLPTTVALDARGRIVETLRGPQSASDFRRALAIAAES
jgi:cytochrome c biogenesis protein CcmG, thiol:disulfide interchange protein DsbE